MNIKIGAQRLPIGEEEKTGSPARFLVNIPVRNVDVYGTEKQANGKNK